ncbi:MULTISPECIES: Fe2+-dependent dioxygenase [unclassified Halomonas]|jgi:PKHD-type hydroxylase|uniref:Fe2+-dependent dioxygenase n=1 Tax=Halomonas sp. RT37 TaxID=2950872 RepID=A0AAU7KD53_9GAMM|nr:MULTISPECIES: Fe2+-dependent dioxygenase [unclassified Halomonas]MBR9880244.1 Fe2+-dependent dioxygenase [Gammaproteobacteria bacterium]MBS8268207.1 Fe2+-dependent dioxygenase [Halomonas litopenaei]KJZ06494.1 nuclease PIN [Halomonas sp. S2151]MBY6111697.1 Fe2+-dependent dioxygenase [Halomonas sp. DP1Y21-3]MCJ8287450.1 Fe2+-dependent dioxygenase [Halomonas sp.]|tara:strand:+ start:401 stop:1075 length:675 start_codon:yes stop_codon:yes gene_type:complete
MILCIDKVLTDDQLQRIRQTLDASDFRDGRETAGWHARTVKRNQQASSQEPAIAALRDEVMQTLSAHTLFQIAARPRRMKPVMFSRYQQGMTYGNHVDDAVMPTPQGPMRTDLSFTIFLGDPDSYEGGELVTETTQGEQRFKLPAGSMILYPSSTLHRVDPVTQGQRLAAVGWLQSQVRHPEQREVLFDLDTTRRQIFERDGKTAEFDSISKSLANLLRMWAEI